MALLSPSEKEKLLGLLSQEWEDATETVSCPESLLKESRGEIIAEEQL